MSTDSSYMLTWAGVIYNDLLAPIRRGWSQRRGILVNRLIIAGIGLFLLGYGLWYPMKGDLWTYLTLASTVYVSSMSVLLVACCYWRRANAWGAGAAIICGAVLPILFFVAQELPATRHLAARVGPHYLGITTYVLTALAMVVGSLVRPRER
jgi:SSS family solute:Na+ symporter